MQGFNKYHPPDYDPSKHASLNAYHGKHALGDRARKLDKGILIVRFELPYNIWCSSCNNHIGQGVRYNAEKSKVGMYYSTPILNFRCKCHLCQHWFEIRTDPANTRYVVHSGARQKNEEWDPAENGGVVLDAKPVDGSAPDTFTTLERSVTQKTRALSAAAALHALEEDRASYWSDPYTASSALRSQFRRAKKVRVESESKAGEVKERLGLGERVGVQDLRTPAREEDRRVEDGEWERARGEKERVGREREERRRREREQVGWTPARGRESGSRSLASSSGDRIIAARPRTKSATSSSSKPSAVQALSSKLRLASALKADPFRSAPTTSSPKPAAPSSSSSAGRLARAKQLAGVLVGGGAGVDGRKRKREGD